MSNANTNLQPLTSSVLHNDTDSSCSTSKVQEKTQLSRSRCINSLREVKSQFKFLTETLQDFDTLQDFGTMPIFKRTFSQDLDLLEQHITKEIISKTDCKTILTKLITTFENAFNSEFKEYMKKYTRFDAQSFKDAMICNMDSIGNYILEIILHQQRTPHLLKQKKLMHIQEGHSNPIQALNIDSLKVDLVVIQNTCSEKEDILSQEDLKGTRIEHGFKWAFMSLFGQDADTFTNKYFVEYTRIKVKHIRDTLLQHMGNVKKFVAERTCHQRHGTELEVQDDNNMSRNDTDADDSYIRPSYDEEPMAETSAMYEKTSPRSNLRWKPTGRIFKSIGLRWIPIGKLFDSCTSKIDSEPSHGSIVDIPNIHECKQTLDVSAGTSINVQKEQSFDLSA
nr:hypothetical protein [Tanacetum cinerariifolium]